MLISRDFCIPNKETFLMPKVARFLASKLAESKVIADPFSRGKRIGTVTNDINESFDADYHLDCSDFAAELFRKQIWLDAVLFDPPYSIEQAKRSYELTGNHFSRAATQMVNRWSVCKDLLALITKKKRSGDFFRLEFKRVWTKTRF